MGIQKIVGALLFSILLLLISLFIPNPTSATYSVSGQVVDARTGQGIPGYSNNSIYIYADNTLTGTRTVPDSNGNWQLSVEDGLHSIEIANAGSIGWGPASPEKVTVTGNQNIVFRINRGYDVVGRVVDQRNGNGVHNVTIYSDFSSPNSTTTDFSGNYRLTNLRYGGAGHTIYVRPSGDYQAVGGDYQVVNPPAGQTEITANFTLTGQTYPTPSYYTPSYTYPTPSYTYPTPSYSYPTPSYSYPTPAYTYPTPGYTYPTPGTGISASCNVAITSTSGTTAPVYVTLSGGFSSSNQSAYYPNRYEWDYNGDGITDNTTNTNSFSIGSPRGALTTTGTYRPRLRVYYQGSSSPIECTSNQTITVNPSTGAGIPYCTISASPTSATVPFYVNFSGNFYNQGGTNYTPNRYRFYVGNERETVTTNQFSANASHYLETPGSHQTRLEVRHEGGTITCYGPGVFAYSTSGTLFGLNDNRNILGASIETPARLALEEAIETASGLDAETGFGKLLAEAPQRATPIALQINPNSPIEALIGFLQNFFSTLSIDAQAREKVF